jgi:hypothetical protein
MPMTFDSLRALHLAGRISIPSPYPEPGWISLDTVSSQEGNSRFDEEMVRVAHVQSNRLVISRLVLIDDVEVVHLADDSKNPEALRDRWCIGHAGVGVWLDALRRADAVPLVGTIFVRETTPVLMHVQVSMTAGESVEYYPPVVRDRSDAHYCLSGQHGPEACLTAEPQRIYS